MPEKATPKKQLSASQKLGQLIAETMTENGLDDDLHVLDTQPVLERKAGKIVFGATEQNEQSEKSVDTVTEAGDTEQLQLFDQDNEDDEYVEVKGALPNRENLKRGMKRARAYAAKKKDEIFASAVRARTALQLGKAPRADVVSDQEHEKRDYKKALKAGAVIVALAGVGYLAYKGIDGLNSGSESDLGENVGRAAAEQAEDARAAAEAAEQARIAAEAAQPVFEYTVQTGDMPWNVLENAGIPAEEIMNRLDSAAQKLNAAEGIPYEWHGSGTSQWLEVNGQSDTSATMQMLKPYL